MTEHLNKTTLAILSQKVKPLKPPIDRLDDEAKSKFLELDEVSKAIYSIPFCQSCREKLKNKEISESIKKGTPRLCEKHQAEFQAEIEKLAPFFKDLI